MKDNLKCLICVFIILIVAVLVSVPNTYGAEIDMDAVDEIVELQNVFAKKMFNHEYWQLIHLERDEVDRAVLNYVLLKSHKIDWWNDGYNYNCSNMYIGIAFIEWVSIMESVYVDDYGNEYNVYEKENITVYYVDEVNIRYDVDDDRIVILPYNYPCKNIRAVASTDSICDYVLASAIEFSDKKSIKIIFEIGGDESTSGFYTQLIPHDEKYVVFFDIYDEEEPTNN